MRNVILAVCITTIYLFELWNIYDIVLIWNSSKINTHTMYKKSHLRIKNKYCKVTIVILIIMHILHIFVLTSDSRTNALQTLKLLEQHQH